LDDKCSSLLAINSNTIFPYLLAVEEFVRCDVKTGDKITKFEDLKLNNETRQLQQAISNSADANSSEKADSDSPDSQTNSSEKTDPDSEPPKTTPQKNASGDNDNPLGDETPLITEKNVGSLLNFGS
jgi:hypothetical protein